MGSPCQLKQSVCNTRSQLGMRTIRSRHHHSDISHLEQGKIVGRISECQHVHVRDPEDGHRPTLDPVRLRDTVQALRESTDLVVQLSTGGSVHDPLERRLTVLDAEPDSCSLTCGTVNFGDDVFLNPSAHAERFNNRQATWLGYSRE